MKMWSAFRKDVIKAKLLQIMDSGDEVTVWQNRRDERNQFQASIIEVDESNTILELETDYLDTDYDIVKDKTLFVHYAKGDALFKRDAFKTEGLRLIVKTPIELMIKEKRSVERLSYKYQDFKSISFYIKNGEETDRYSSILKDISIEGLCLVLSKEESLKISTGDDLYLSSIADQDIKEDLLAKVCYMTPYNVSKEAESRLVQIGLKFISTLESVTYKSINSIIEKKQIRQRGLNVSSFNGLTQAEQDKALRNIAESNLPLANNIREQNENLDKLRYLTLDMKRAFLLEVNLDLLAASLRLSSKELIFELISELTDTMKEEFLFKLDQAKSASAVNKAQDEIVKFIRKKENLGELVLNPNSFEVIV